MTPEQDRAERYKRFNRDRWTSLELYTMIAVISLVALGAVWWEYYKFCDCRQVGHSILYCIFARG